MEKKLHRQLRELLLQPDAEEYSQKNLSKELYDSATKFFSFKVQPQDLKVTKIILGQGAYGNVYVGLYHGVKVAVKVVSADNFDPQEVVNSYVFFILKNRLLYHPNIINCAGWMNCESKYYLLFEIMNHSLKTILHGRPNEASLTNQQKLDLLLQILSGISFLHSKNLAHLDLKPDNILVKNKFFLTRR
jgi:serine/threonine protein kinase